MVASLLMLVCPCRPARAERSRSDSSGFCQLIVIAISLLFIPTTLGSNLLLDDADRALVEFTKCHDEYMKDVEECIRRAEADVAKVGNIDLTRVFGKEVDAFRNRSVVPALVRMKKYEKYWKDSRRNLLEAQANLEAALLSARRVSIAASNPPDVKNIDARLKTLREKWIGRGVAPPIVELVKTAEANKNVEWHYVTADPGLQWTEHDFEQKNWLPGFSGFASPGTGNINIRTPWIQERIWLRKKIDISYAPSPEDVVVLRLRYDEDAEIFVNGARLMNAPGWNGGYGFYLLDQKQKQLFHEGSNTLAVFCRNTGGGQAIDLGLTVYRGASDVIFGGAKQARDPDLFEVGAVWEGPRIHLDPVVPGEQVSLKMSILQRMGNTFLAHVIATGPKNVGEHLVGGEIVDNELKVIEPTSVSTNLVYDGSILNNVWQYKFRGRGGGGAERYGSGEMKPK